MGERGDIDGPAAQRRGIGRSSDGRGVATEGCGSAAVHGEAGEVGDGEWQVEAWTHVAECARLPDLGAGLDSKFIARSPAEKVRQRL